jgi:uncharacterized protein
VILVIGGKWHDFAFARQQLSEMIVSCDCWADRFAVVTDYEAAAAFLTPSTSVVSYTCDVRPTEATQGVFNSWVTAGGRWLALHGTNAALDLLTPSGRPQPVQSPRCFPTWATTLGSQFVAHPPIHDYVVTPCSDHWLVGGLEAFRTNDELYLSQYHDADQLVALLDTTWSGEATGFGESDWSFEARGTNRHLVSYIRPLGAGAVLYNTLGHCRGHGDMQPLMQYYPVIERGSWTNPTYRELLRRGLAWASGSDADVRLSGGS